MSKQYEDAGVSLEAGYESVRRIKKHIEKTNVKGVMGNIGSFGGMFDLSCLGYKEPVLVSGTDGVGTKLKLAFMMDKHDTIGQDVVAMCVNDVLAQGAKPLFFLDYIAVGKNYPEKIEAIVKGVSDGCVLADCGLIGGETAEMPDMYDANHYDIAGFCVGAVEKSKLLHGQNIASGQILVGLPSSGCHSNGFSLIRKVLLKDAKLDLNRYYPEFNKTLGEELLTPTKIYVKAIKKLLNEGVDIKGMSHITGGGFFENIPRMLKEGQGVSIDVKSFPRPKIFDLIMEKGEIDEKEMYNVFNMGIGFVMALDPKDVTRVQELLTSIGEPSYVIGEVTDKGEVELKW